MACLSNQYGHLDQLNKNANKGDKCNRNAY